MTSYFQLRKRYNLIYLLFFLIAVVILGFWVVELRDSLSSLNQRQEELLQKHQELLLERKAVQLKDMFHEVYQSTRTIALLPMIRSVKGPNRRSENEDVVTQGRLSLDAHRTLQQIYTNLQHSVQLSEVYLVLDGFDPTRDVPFFMYDGLIAGNALTPGGKQEWNVDQPKEVEDEEYRHFPVQLDWFRKHAPQFVWAHALDKIPVRLSPVVLTCDNSQYLSVKQGNAADTRGFVFAMPVYAIGDGNFKGMVTAVLRTNILEAVLLGVPFIPVTPEDEWKRVRAGWSMPDPSSLILREKEFGITVRDRRNPALENEQPSGGRWATIPIDLKTGQNWELSHLLTAEEVGKLSAPIIQERQRVVIGRVLLLVALVVAGIWNFVMMNRSRRELMEMAHFDPLTSLPNRRLFLDQLHRSLARARRHKRKLALLFLDVRNFSAINDAFGNQGGDQILMAISARLERTVRESDTVSLLPHDGIDAHHAVARLGGDEFTIICEDIKHSDDITALLTRLLAAIRQPFSVGDASLEIGVSIGVSVYPEDADEGDKLLVCADTAMHESRKGSLPYFFFNDQLRQRSDRVHRLSLELNRALELNQFEVFYQPKASLKDGRIVSLEALLRWRHPELGMISPVEFIPILESGGQIVEVGQWVLEQSCRSLSHLDTEGFGDVKISVNVSVKQLNRGNFHETVADTLVRYGTDPHRLILEVTESMMIENFEEARLALLQLVNLEVKLAIDDFGTGYSSLTYLQHLPLSYLKLDKAFIDGMDSAETQHIVESVIYLSKCLSLETIAEGVETVEQRNLLAGIGCDMIQGYLLSKPIPLADIVVWLRQYQWQHRPFAAS